MKRTILFLLPCLTWAQGIQVSPSNPSVNQGGTITFTVDRPATFTVIANGWVESSQGTSTVYHALTSAEPARHVLNGCLTAPTDSVYTTRIDSVPVHASSNSWIYSTLIAPVSVTYQWGTNVIDNSQPAAPETFRYSHLLNGAMFPVIAPGNKKRETGADTTDGENDHHMLVLNHQTCQFYETYQEGNLNPYCPGCTAASGWTYHGTDSAQPNGNNGGGTTDAAGLPLAPLTLHLSEIKAGSVNHALRFTACAGCIGAQFLWPAISTTASQPGSSPMGARFRLKANFDISGFPPAAQTVLTALKQYGMFLADIGMTGQISASSDVTEDPSVVSDLQTIQDARIDASNFEVVDESSLMLSTNLNTVWPYNAYAHAANSSILQVADASNPSNFVYIPIALQPVMVGTPDPAIVVQAGTGAFTIPAWVNGSANQSVTWSISPGSGAGTINSAGVYTAPAWVPGLTTATLTATSVVDANATTSIEVTVLPSGAIRIDSGSPSPTVDDRGNPWLPDLGFETGTYNATNDNYPVNAWGKIANWTQTASFMYTWGDDILYRFHVPNGRYLVTMTFGVGGCVGQYNRGTFDNGLILGPLNIESQGQVVMSNWDFGPGVGYNCRVAQSQSFPATVTDTTLRLSIRATGGDNSHSEPLLNSLVIMPSAPAPGPPPPAR